jgi:hypothetical protein
MCEQVQYLVEHLAVLRGDADTRVYARRLRQSLHHRGHFDGLRGVPKTERIFISQKRNA